MTPKVPSFWPPDDPPSIEFGHHLRSNSACTFDPVHRAPSIEFGLHLRSNPACTVDPVHRAPSIEYGMHPRLPLGSTFLASVARRSHHGGSDLRPRIPSRSFLPRSLHAARPAVCFSFFGQRIRTALLRSKRVYTFNRSRPAPSVECALHFHRVRPAPSIHFFGNLRASKACTFDRIRPTPSIEFGLHLRSNSAYTFEFGLHLRSTSAYTFERPRPAPSSEHGLHIRSSSAYTFDGMRPAPSIECGLHLRSAGSDLRARIRSRPFPPRPFSIDLGTFVCNGMAVRPFSVIWLDTRGRGASRCMTSPSHIPLCAFGDGLEYSRPCMRIPSPMVACIAWCRNASSGVSVLTGDADMLQWPNGQPLCITGAGVWAFLGACQWRSTTTPHIPKLPARMPIITSTALQEKIFLDHVRSRLLACVQPSSAWVVVSLLIGL